MEPDDIKNLADILAKHHFNDVARMLQVTSLSLRNTSDDNVVNKLKNQQRLLLIARDFLRDQSITDNDWRQSSACFEQLTDWFDSAPHIENHKQLSMLSWYLQLDRILSSKIQPAHIIVLGAAYFGEPNKFAAFLYWLLENDVSIVNIVNSKILHRYFAYHICDISVLHQTYALLANRSQKSGAFLEQANTIPSQMRGFANHQHEDGALSSYNILGGLFAHNDTIEVVNENALKKLEFHINFEDMHSELFDLFGWELINVLNFKMHSHRSILKALIRSSSRQKILDNLPQYILSGKFSKETGMIILSCIASVMPIYNTPNNDNTLFDLIKSEPFYIHALQNNALNSPLFSQLGRNEIIQTLCTDVKYKNMYHLPYLVRLSKSLTEGMCYLLGEYTSVEHSQVLEVIFNLLLESGSALFDEDFKLIIPIIPELIPLIRNKMDEYSNNINAAIDAINHGNSDYEALFHLWGSQLSHVNLFKRIDRALSLEYIYPFIIYQLHAKILQDNFASCARENRPFELKALLEVLSEDPGRRLRIMQESLYSDCISESLIEAILDLATELNILEQCIMQSFGDERSVLYYAYTSNNIVLRRQILPRISMEDDVILSIINTAIVMRDVLGLDRIISLIQMTNSIRNKTMSFLLNYVENTRPNSGNMLLYASVWSCYLNKLHFFLNTANADTLLKEHIVSIFRLGVQYSRLYILYSTCRLTGENALLASEINMALEQAADRAQWRVLAVLCGLEMEILLNPSTFKQGNISLYLSMVERYRENTGIENITEALIYVNSDEESLLHIAANHCSFKMFRKCFLYLEKHLSNRDLQRVLEMTTASGEALQCEEENKDQQKINDYIEIQRKHYSTIVSPLARQTPVFYPSPFNSVRRQRIENVTTNVELNRESSLASTVSREESLERSP